MPNIKGAVKIEKEKKRLADEIATQSAFISYPEKLEVLRACSIHEDTFDRYKKEVKKIPTANKILVEIKNVIANRETIPA